MFHLLDVPSLHNPSQSSGTSRVHFLPLLEILEEARLCPNSSRETVVFLGLSGNLLSIPGNKHSRLVVCDKPGGGRGCSSFQIRRSSLQVGILRSIHFVVTRTGWSGRAIAGAQRGHHQSDAPEPPWHRLSLAPATAKGARRYFRIRLFT